MEKMERLDNMSKNEMDFVTINDIAELTGVSKSTVSRYLNGGSVSKKTSDKISKIVKETNYFPNSFAQSLKAKKTSLIGTVVPRLDSYSQVHSLAGIDNKLKETSYELLIINTYQEVQRELEALQSFAKQKVAGIIFFATILTQEHYELLSKLRVPVVIVAQAAKGYHCVLNADYEAGFKLGEYVHKLGHKKITYVGVAEKDEAVGVMRKKGFFEALRQYEIEPRFYETTFAIQDAYTLALEMLLQHDGTYIACATDNIALGVLKAAHELNIDVPDQISISGFGGYDVTDVVSPAITTVKYDYLKLGAVAAACILELADQKEVPAITYIKNSLEIKKSTKKIN